MRIACPASAARADTGHNFPSRGIVNDPAFRIKLRALSQQ